MKIPFFIVCLLTAIPVLSAQSLTPEVIASSGTSFSSASAQLEFTIGEVTTSTLNAGSNTLTQGFHQPEIHFASLENYHDDVIFSLYPNPTEQFVTIETSSEELIQLHVYNSLGQEILTSSVFSTKLTVDVQVLAAGSYTMIIATSSGKPMHSYTVIKKSNY